MNGNLQILVGDCRETLKSLAAGAAVPVLCLECGTTWKHATADCPFRPAAPAAGQPVENSSN